MGGLKAEVHLLVARPHGEFCWDVDAWLKYSGEWNTLLNDVQGLWAAFTYRLITVDTNLIDCCNVLQKY